MNATRPLHIGNRACDITSRRNHHASIGQNGKYGFQVDSLTFAGGLGADAVDHAQRDFGAWRNYIILGVGGVRRTRILLPAVVLFGLLCNRCQANVH